MGGVVGKKIGAERGEKLVAGRVFQHDVHADVVGEYPIAQSLYRLVVLHHLSLLHVLGADVVGEFVVLPFAEVESLHGEALDGLSFVLYLPVFLHVHTGQFLEYVLQVVVAGGCEFGQVVDDRVASHRHGWPLHLHFLELKSLLNQPDGVVFAHRLPVLGISHEGGLQLVARMRLCIDGKISLVIGPNKENCASAVQQHHRGLGQRSSAQRVDYGARDGVLSLCAGPRQYK